MSAYRTHFVYIAPSDRTSVILAVSSAIELCAHHLQAWMRTHMGNSKTITLNAANIVTVCRSTHPASWFSTNDPSANGAAMARRWPTTYPFPHGQAGRRHGIYYPRGYVDTSGWFWVNSLDELSALAGGGFGQEYDTWVVYVDAPLAHGQYIGGACIGFSGCAVLAEEDVLAVQGLPTVHGYSKCREIGGCGHELLHTFGIPHPDGDPDYGIALMGTGYSLYPNCILTQSEKDQLNTNPFFSFYPRVFQPVNLCHFDDGLIVPRPRPVPHPRPQKL